MESEALLVSPPSLRKSGMKWNVAYLIAMYRQVLSLLLLPDQTLRKTQHHGHVYLSSHN